ncbi:MAG: hypothetical protein CBC65_000095 [Rhodothermaceae bacterium TMED105]|mgnify:CR=1 FL=1|nr:MAG: hypothetical protein CBC65_000210 [Rhodothermaceae bacterium TMED105]RPF82668.1 MAG: hypothetical protein CBC65_000095 [Rhodothermaceae bacterium TMED105]|tara:strand:+ start:15265 stop:15810 length:546 start_codon:yes stop_codon:yes gene_type:complete
MEWPTEINDKIVGMLSNEEQRMVRSICRMTPRSGGAASNPFFHVNEAKPKQAIHKIRTVEKHIPELFVPLYGSYTADTEFSNDTGLVLFCEDDMIEMCPGILDVGFKYSGMGHVSIFSYSTIDRKMLTHLDGGANGWDRVHNSNLRQTALNDYQFGTVKPSLTVQDLLEWWEEHHSSAVGS